MLPRCTSCSLCSQRPGGWVNDVQLASAAPPTHPTLCSGSLGPEGQVTSSPCKLACSWERGVGSRVSFLRWSWSNVTVASVGNSDEGRDRRPIWLLAREIGAFPWSQGL